MRSNMHARWVIAALLVSAFMLACAKDDNGKQNSGLGAGGTSLLPGSTAGVGAGSGFVAGSGGASVAGTGVTLAGSGGSAGLPTSGSGGIGGAAGTVAGTGVAAGSGGAAGSVPPTPHGPNCLQAGSGNYGEPGPYQVGKMDVDLGMIESSQHTGKFTIFYPMPLETSCLHPIVAWGNGTGVMGSDVYAFFNSNAASWGMVVAASQEDNTGSGNFHKAGIDYLLKQNADPSSMFYQKLSTRAGVAGHSQGGFGATIGSMHANVEAEVSVAGGGTPKAGISFMCLTGTMDQVEQPCTASYMAATGPAFLGDWMNGTHTGTETASGYFQKDPGTLAMQRSLAAWFRCWLADDDVACALFKGAPTSCGLCSDTGWAKHESRNF